MTTFPTRCGYHRCPNEPTHVQFGRPGRRAGQATAGRGGIAWDVCTPHATKAVLAAVCRDPRLK